MTFREFEDVVREALETLPEMFRERLQNIAVIVQEVPTPSQAGRVGATDDTLFGLYEGIPFGERGSHYSGALPDKITIFKRPIERACRNRADMIRCIQETVLHEVGHFFGFSDEQLEEMGY